MQTLKLVLASLISHWDFFSQSTVSFSVDYRIFNMDESITSPWRPVISRPIKESLLSFVVGIFYKPSWNQAIYLMDCTDQLIEDKSDSNIEHFNVVVKSYLMKTLPLRLKEQAEFFQVRIESVEYNKINKNDIKSTLIYQSERLSI
jgi:hypothetical protein